MIHSKQNDLTNIRCTCTCTYIALCIFYKNYAYANARYVSSTVAAAANVGFNDELSMASLLGGQGD